MHARIFHSVVSVVSFLRPTNPSVVRFQYRAGKESLMTYYVFMFSTGMRAEPIFAESRVSMMWCLQSLSTISVHHWFPQYFHEFPCMTAGVVVRLGRLLYGEVKNYAANVFIYFSHITWSDIGKVNPQLSGFKCVLHVHHISLVPRPSTRPVFDRLQYAKMEGEGLGNFIMWSAARLTSHILDAKAHSRSYPQLPRS